MPVRETHRSLPETWKYFDPSVFSMNDPVVFHNPRTHRWERGTVTQVPVFDRDNRRIFLNNIAGGMELEIPPKRVDPKILTGVINLKIEDEFGVHNDVPYQVSVDASLNPIWNIGPDGEIEVTLVTASTMVAPNRKEISNVNLESLRSVQEIEQAESDINVHLGVLRGDRKSVV